MVTGLLQGPLGLTPAGLQVFGTGPEEHAAAVESVKKAKVRLPLAGQMLPLAVLVSRGSGWRGAGLAVSGPHRAPETVTAPLLQAPTYALKVSVMRAKNLLAKDPNGEWGASRVWGPWGRGWD